VEDDGRVLAVDPVLLRDPGSTVARPNPFRDQVRVDFSLPASMPVGMVIYDLSGRRVRDLPLVFLAQGAQSFAWDGVRDDGSPATDGVYFMHVRGPGFEATRRVVRLR